MKYVIYKRWGKYYITSEENYRARISNKSQILTLHYCSSYEEALNLAKRYFKDVEIINATGE